MNVQWNKLFSELECASSCFFKLFLKYKVIYKGVLIIELLEDEEFQFDYISSPLSNTQYKRKQSGLKLQ